MVVIFNTHISPSPWLFPVFLIFPGTHRIMKEVLCCEEELEANHPTAHLMGDPFCCSHLLMSTLLYPVSHGQPRIM